MAQASSSDLTEKLTVAGTCAGRPFTTVYRFDAPGRAWVQEVVRLAERTVGSRGSSPGVAHLGPPPNPEVFQPEAGAPIEVSLTFSQGLGNGSIGPPPDSGAASLALYEWVGPDEYPYPDPPAALVPLKPLNLTSDQSVAMVRSDPKDPAAERPVTFFWPVLPPTESLSVEMRAQTPGVLRVLLDGAEVSQGYWWDYRQDVTWSSANLHRPILNRLAVRGDRIDLTVIPERMTGAWAVALYDDTAADR
jgi:hypothetical protein